MKKIPPSKPISLNLELLLQAALLPGEAAKDAYIKWKKAVDLELFNDEVSYNLLPKLYLNQQNNIEVDKTLKILKGIYRRTWLENQLLSSQLLVFLKLFMKKQIDFIVLSHTPFVLDLLQYKGAFSLNNFDLLIHRHQIMEADKILRENGWLTKQNPAADGSLFYRNKNSAQIILRQNQSIFSELIWKTTTESDLGGTKVKSLSLNQRIVSLCKTNFGNDENEFWVFYFYLIFSETPTMIDWENLIVECQQHQICAELFVKLKYLNEVFAVNIPSERLKSLQKKATKEMSPPGKWQISREAYQALQKSYRQNLSHNSSAPSFWGFIKFLREHWQVNSTLSIPWQIGKRLLKDKRNF